MGLPYYLKTNISNEHRLFCLRKPILFYLQDFLTALFSSSIYVQYICNNNNNPNILISTAALFVELNCCATADAEEGCGERNSRCRYDMQITYDKAEGTTRNLCSRSWKIQR